MATCPSSSAGRPAVRTPSPRRRASRLIDTGRPLRTSNTRRTDRRGLDQGLEGGARPLLVAMGAGVGDGRGRLRGEQHEHLLVLGGELGAVLLLAEEEVADLHPAMAHRRSLAGLDNHPVGGETERGDVGGHVRHPQEPSDHCFDLPRLVRREAGEDGVLEFSGAVDGRCGRSRSWLPRTRGDEPQAAARPDGARSIAPPVRG